MAVFSRVLVFGVLLFSSISFAVNVGPVSAASSATAGAGRAAVEAADIHSLNPAMLVHQASRDFHTGFAKNSWVVGITDNARDSLVPAGLSFARSRIIPTAGAEPIQLEDLTLSLGGGLGRNFSLGVTGHQKEARLLQQRWSQNNLDVGFAWVPKRNLGLALVAYDVLGEDEAAPAFFRSAPTSALGVNYLYGDFVRLRMDMVSEANHSFHRPSVLAGYESQLNQFFLVRLGYGFLNSESRDVATGGIGFDLPRFRLNYAFQVPAKGGGETWHTVDLGIPF